MSVAALTLQAQRGRGLSRRWLVFAGMMAACAAFMFFDLRILPIVLWDESRNAANALEMHRRGFSLVTTYGLRPDVWNTKPPLLIWLMWAAMAVFGPSEWAMRLPSMLAAMGTLALVLSFARRVTGSTGTAVLAAFLLATSLGFFGEFGARTGDYDALLCLFTTAYLYVLFFALHRRRPGAGRLLQAGGLVAGAVMTKSVMGLVPGAGVALYLLATGRWTRPLRSPWYTAAALTGAAAVLAFLVLRERAAPGYLRAVAFNDFGGRFGTALDGHRGPPWFYLETTFVLGFFSAGPLALATPLGLLRTRGRPGLGLLFSLCVAVATLVVLSLSGTKLNHYALPIYPFLAIASAIAVRGAWTRLGATAPDRYVRVGVATLLVAIIAGRALWMRTTVLPAHEFQPKALYGELFRGLERRGVGAVDVVEGGVATLAWRTSGVPQDYAPQLYVYTLLARERGLAATRITPAALALEPPGRLAASCDPAYRAAVLRLGRDVSETPGCVVVRTR